MSISTYRRPIKTDSRGYLVEVWKKFEDHVTSRITINQINIISVAQHQQRGGHYHTYKYEYFFPISGKGVFAFEDLELKTEWSVDLDSVEPELILIPPMIRHTIKNTEDQAFVLLVCMDRVFEQETADTYVKYPR